MPNKECKKCNAPFNRNFFNRYHFDLDLDLKTYLKDCRHEPTRRMNIEITDFIANTRNSIPHGYWTLEFFLDYESSFIFEEMPIEQLERFYEFLKVALNKTS